MIKLFAPMAAAILVSACAGYPSGPSATATLRPTTGNAVSGTVTFTKIGDAVRVAGEVTGLAPNSEHGFHIHEKGDCSSGDGMSAGGHFNPTGAAHGSNTASEHHAGDLLSLKSDSSGLAKFSYTTGSLTVGDGVADINGRGLIVHRDADDFKTQPTGNSGPRLACAVIARG